MLKPSRRKLLFALVPFMFPLFQIWLFIQITYDFFWIDVDSILFDIEEIVDGVFYVSEVFIATPFESFLRPLGWWSSNGIFVAPNGPLLPGSFVVAITYSILMYIAISFLSAAWKKRHSN